MLRFGLYVANSVFQSTPTVGGILCSGRIVYVDIDVYSSRTERLEMQEILQISPFKLNERKLNQIALYLECKGYDTNTVYANGCVICVSAGTDYSWGQFTINEDGIITIQEECFKELVNVLEDKMFQKILLGMVGI